MNKLVRKTLVMSIILIMVMCLCACSGLGKTANCNIIPIESEIYTQEDYEEACQVVFDCFKGFTGCSMTEIRYTGDDRGKHPNCMDLYFTYEDTDHIYPEEMTLHFRDKDVTYNMKDIIEQADLLLR